ncbi:MAG UNVERIFIED_CONTAM: hypothetical protein LVR18_14010 [Planctomycetaceae bacterium]
MNPFLGFHEAFLGGADGFKVFTKLFTVAFGKPDLEVACFTQHVVEDAFAATDLAQNLGLVRRPSSAKSLAKASPMLFSAGTMLPPSVQPKSLAPALNAQRVKTRELAERGGDILVQ